MKIAVLGCGPAGLMAVHGVRAVRPEADVAIFSKARKSHMFGAQYLHEPIPGLEARKTTVDYQLRGSMDDYRRKVYGPKWDGKVSPDDYIGEHDAWNIRDAYDQLWSLYGDWVNDVQIDPAGVRALYDDHKFDLVVNTIPLDILCHRGHSFGAVEIVAAGDAPEHGVKVSSMYHCPYDTVVCNGESAPSWYRMSRIFDYTTVEWPGGLKVPVNSAANVVKPTFNNCDCWPDMLKVGRYGSWTKGVLSHEAFFKVKEALS